MIKPRHEMNSAIEIDLNGPDGNAFVLMGFAKSYSKSLGWTTRKSDMLLKRMQSGDYDNLVDEFDKAFGHIVTLYR